MIFFPSRFKTSRICHPQAWWLLLHDPLNFYHDHNSVACVHSNAYALFVDSQTYVSGYKWDFVVHMVYFLNHVVYRQEMNSMIIFTIIIPTNLKVTIIISIYFLLIDISKEFTSKPNSRIWCLQFTLTNVQYSHYYQISMYDGRYPLLVY